MNAEELDSYLWETLYILKELYDHGKGEELLKYFAPYRIDRDDYCDIAREIIVYTFEDTRLYYNEDKEIEVYVLLDPIITEFFHLCEQYESEKEIPPKENRFRKSIGSAIGSGLCFNSFDYDYIVYDDTKKKNGCRIVLLFGCEFFCHHEVPGGLLDVYDAFEYQTSLLKAELGINKKGEIIMLPKNDRKEAA